MAGLLNQFQARLAELAPAWRERRFLVAFSGGLDSTALLHLAALSLPAAQLAAAHLNHGLRGPESDRDQRFASEVAADLRIKFITKNADVPALAKSRKKGLEEAARTARYRFLTEAAREAEADFILTAHQADDQAESVLMSLVRGGGGPGAAGIAPVRAGAAPILRPLLGFGRAELRGWLSGRGLEWVEDASNSDPRHPRNFLRHEVMPRLLELNPRLAEALGRSAEIRRAEEDFWQARAAALLAECAVEEGAERLLLKRSFLGEISLAERRRLLYQALTRLWRARPERPEPLTFQSVDFIMELLDRAHPGGLDLPGGLRAEVDRNFLKLGPSSRRNKA